MNESAIAVEHLSKSYGANVAVADVSFTIPPGSICGLLGPNGAGKTTTMKCLLGLAKPTSGRITIDGGPVRPAMFERLAFVPERPALFEKLRVGNHLQIVQRAQPSFDAARARTLLDAFGVDVHKRVCTLSKGQQTALALSLAFAIRPAFMILDEPASGLDPLHQRTVLDLMIEAAAQGATILFSSHQISQVERAADRVVILKRGRVILDGEVDALKEGEKVIEAVWPERVPDLDGLDADVRIRRLERPRNRLVRAYVLADPAGIVAFFNQHGASSVQIYDRKSRGDLHRSGRGTASRRHGRYRQCGTLNICASAARPPCTRSSRWA